MIDKDRPFSGAEPASTRTQRTNRQIGHRLSVRRLMLQLQIDELARRVGTTADFLRSIETGEQRCPSETLAALARELRVTTGWFFADLTGNEPIDAKATIPAPLFAISAPAEIREGERQTLLEAFDRIEDPAVRKTLLAIVAGFADRPSTE